MAAATAIIMVAAIMAGVITAMAIVAAGTAGAIGADRSDALKIEEAGWKRPAFSLIP
jgi:hypothetical protein